MSNFLTRAFTCNDLLCTPFLLWTINMRYDAIKLKQYCFIAQDAFISA